MTQKKAKANDPTSRLGGYVWWKVAMCMPAAPGHEPVLLVCGKFLGRPSRGPELESHHARTPWQTGLRANAN